MAKNLSQVYASNPLSSMQANDLIYAVNSGSDGGITFDNFQQSITKVGTLITGVWNASVIPGQYGGTGVNNAGKTITLGGNLITSGAFNATFTLTGVTNVTFPTSGTLSTTTGTVTSITAGSNLTGGTITGSGTIALSSTPSGLTSLGVADLSLSAGLIAANNGVTISGITSGSPIVLSPNNGFVAINDLGNSIATPLRFYNSAGTQYVGFKAGTLVGSTTWTWPTADAAGVMVSNGSGALSLSASPSVTSMGIGNLSLSGSTISTNQSAFILSASGTDSVISLKTSGSSGYVQIRDNIDTHSVPLRFYDANFPTNKYVSLKAPSALAANLSFTLPATDTANGLMQSNGSGVWSLTATPAGLTSINIAPALGAGSGITISADQITNISANDFVIYAQSSHNIQLSATLGGGVNLKDPTATAVVPLRFYNAGGGNYTGFQAGSLSTSFVYTLPTADAYGVFISDGSANMLLTTQPKICRPIVTVSGTSATFGSSDANTFQQCTNGSTTTLTVPTNATIAFPIGTEIEIYQEGAGQVVIAAAGGVTIESAFSNLKIAAQYTGAVLKKLATNTWSLVGNLTA